MKKSSEEEDHYSVSAKEHTLTASLGILILVYILWRHRHKTDKQQPRQQVNCSADNPEDNFTKCQTSTCVTCHKDKSSPVWKDRLESYIDIHTSKSEKFSKLLGILDSDENGQDSRLELQNPTVCFYPTLQTCPWYALEHFSETMQCRDICFLRDNYITIKNEYMNVYSSFLEGDSRGWIENATQSGTWLLFPFINQGERIGDNCRRCPATARVLEALVTLMSSISFGHACFSVLQPSSHIAPHCGPCNLRVRCHLGLQVPENSSLTVAHETKPWVDGDCLIFDDSFLHEARNMSAGPSTAEQSRAILMVDFWHPEISHAEKEALRYAFPPQVCSKI